MGSSRLGMRFAVTLVHENADVPRSKGLFSEHGVPSKTLVRGQAGERIGQVQVERRARR